MKLLKTITISENVNIQAEIWRLDGGRYRVKFNSPLWSLICKSDLKCEGLALSLIGMLTDERTFKIAASESLDVFRTINHIMMFYDKYQELGQYELPMKFKHGGKRLKDVPAEYLLSIETKTGDIIVLQYIHENKQELIKKQHIERHGR